MGRLCYNLIVIYDVEQLVIWNGGIYNPVYNPGVWVAVVADSELRVVWKVCHSCHLPPEGISATYCQYGRIFSMYNYVSHPKDIETLGIVFVCLIFSPFMYRHMQRCQTIDNILHAYSALPLLAVYKPYQKRRAPILSVFYRLYICVQSSPIGKPCVKSFGTYLVFKVHPQSGDFYPPTSGAIWMFSQEPYCLLPFPWL